MVVADLNRNTQRETRMDDVQVEMPPLLAMAIAGGSIGLFLARNIGRLVIWMRMGPKIL